MFKSFGVRITCAHQRKFAGTVDQSSPLTHLLLEHLGKTKHPVESSSARLQAPRWATCLSQNASHLQLHLAKDPEAALFKRLDGLQPAEVTRLEPGEHVFAVYGKNFDPQRI
jgi:hypothetical protein